MRPTRGMIPPCRTGLSLSGALRAAIALALAAALAPAAPARAHHGPGFSAGARSVPNGEVLERGRVSVTLRYEQTEYEDLSDEDAAERARASGSIESMERSRLVSSTLAAGVAGRFEMSASIGWFQAVGAREHVFDPVTGESASFRLDPDGLTDLWLNGKFTAAGGERGRLSLQCGVKAPTGRRDVDVAPDAPAHGGAKSGAFFHALEATALPIGSGSWDALVGAGFTTRLSDRLWLDAGGHFTLRTEADGVRLGNGLDAAALLANRLSRRVGPFRDVALVAQCAIHSVAENHIDGESDGNSGGTTLIVSPGVRLDLFPGGALWIAPQFPIVQDLNGEQVESRYRLVTEFAAQF